ncbi:Deoxyribose-phosphate aldolase, partial [Termitomyces sp. T112]
RLAGSSTIPCCVVGFPLGACTTKSKAFETQVAIEDGAKEIDMVLNIGALKSGNYVLVHDDIATVVSTAAAHPVKVILETVFLTDEEKIAASFIAAEAGAAFVKTCTGYSGGGASVMDVALMKKAVRYKGNVQVKASAGIKSLNACLEMLEAGADRIGTSSGVAIMKDAETVPNESHRSDN